jgi:xanthine dehydrogenase YagR molybdenum-binding subunit
MPHVVVKLMAGRELGMVGNPAAIANAVLHATGKRIHELPITPDKLL